jgi:hypothetical protein
LNVLRVLVDAITARDSALSGHMGSRAAEFDAPSRGRPQASLPRGLVLHPPDVKISDVYFPLSGMVSLLAVMKTGEQIETGIIGREGVVGGSIGYDGWEAIGQSTVQIAGDAWQLPSSKFLELYKASETFRGLINRY